MRTALRVADRRIDEEHFEIDDQEQHHADRQVNLTLQRGATQRRPR